MIDQLLWIDLLAKIAAGLPLLLMPTALIRMLGLPRTSEPFYPRLLGALLLAIALALAIEGAGGGRSGLGLAGAGAINLSGAAVLATLLILARLKVRRRGRGLLWFVTGAMGLFAIVELIAA